MLYVICLIQSNSKKATHYRLFDTSSDSPMLVSEAELKDIISNNRSQVVNAYILNDNVTVKRWLRQYAKVENTHIENGFSAKFSGPNYILIAEEGHKYKIVNNRGEVHRVTALELIERTGLGDIVNCGEIYYKIVDKVIKTYRLLHSRLSGNVEPEKTNAYSIIEYKDLKIRALDMHIIQRDVEFEKNIGVKYEKFDAKTILLYHESMTFDYEIEGNEVRLKKYTGSNKDVVLPPFVTAIMYRAFWGKGIKTIRLNEGLRAIGEEAFLSNRLESVEIPSTVEIVGNAAFRYNEKLFKKDYTIDMTRFKILNEKTILLEQAH